MRRLLTLFVFLIAAGCSNPTPANLAETARVVLEVDGVRTVIEIPSGSRCTPEFYTEAFQPGVRHFTIDCRWPR